MNEVQVLDKKFRELITEEEIDRRIGELAEMINNDYKGEEVVFMGILNGAFLFAAELFKKISLKARISFVKLASYEGTNSSGTVKELIGWNEDIKDKQIIIVEDIVDTGNTIERITDELALRKVAGVKVASLLVKPDCYSKNIPLDYVGFRIPNDFVIGYGLDYSGYGRNLTSLYIQVK
ncbi:MAG: hypoxanthine phosphoribosyltransferase [Bacteroidales bacterium]|jgi:hypoxanthine phosphoribosyltransferase